MKIMLSLIFMLASSLAAAECVKPDAPALPDGASSDMQAMVEGQKAVRVYVAGTEAYLECLNAMDQDAGGEANPEVELARIEAHNGAVDEMEQVAAEFNEQIKEYKAKAK